METTEEPTTKTRPAVHSETSNFVVMTVLFPMLLALAVIAGAIYGIEQAAGLSSFYWVLLSPLFYTAWLVLYLLICAVGMRRRGRRFPKPRRLVIRHLADLRRPENRGGVTMAICMFRVTFNASLPMVQGLGQMSWFRKLLLASYSPSVHVRQGARVWGNIMDPDLTEIGEGAVIGYNTEVGAHVFTALPDGRMVYLSAPIKVGARATVGGSCVVSIGVTIGEDAVVEQMSYVAPYTTIPDGEVWGGIPARKVRMREDPDLSLYSRMSRRAAPVPVPRHDNQSADRDQYPQASPPRKQLSGPTGRKVHPVEVENVLLRMPNVVDALVSARPNPIMGQVMAAAVPLAEPEDAAALKRRVREFCKDQLASYKVPAVIEIADQIPFGARFKKMRRQAQAIAPAWT